MLIIINYRLFIDYRFQKMLNIIDYRLFIFIKFSVHIILVPLHPKYFTDNRFFLVFKVNIWDSVNYIASIIYLYITVHYIGYII